MALDHFSDAEQSELWKLLDERVKPDTDVEDVDRRIWGKYGDEGAVMFTDLAGFTRRSAELGITHFLQIIYPVTNPVATGNRTTQRNCLRSRWRQHAHLVSYRSGRPTMLD